MAGLGEACSNIAAIVFVLVAIISQIKTLGNLREMAERRSCAP